MCVFKVALQLVAAVGLLLQLVVEVVILIAKHAQLEFELANVFIFANALDNTFTPLVVEFECGSCESLLELQRSSARFAA